MAVSLVWAQLSSSRNVKSKNALWIVKFQIGKSSPDAIRLAVVALVAKKGQLKWQQPMAVMDVQQT
jgi:hypothetical protein